MELFSFKIKEIESLLTNKTDKQNNRKNLNNYHSSQIIQAIFWNLLFVYFRYYIAKTSLILEFWNKHFSCALVKFFKDILCTKQPFADIFKIYVLKTWRPSTLFKRDSNVFMWMLRNFYEQFFYRTFLLAAFALNFILLCIFKL